VKPRIPQKQKDYVRSFCRQVSPGQQPIYVKHEPLRGKPLRECFSIVPEHISINGGKQHFGWAIVELRKVWLEAEFHVIWERQDGVLIDLTPRETLIERILFLPDPKREYEGRQVQSVFKALSKKPSVKRFIQLAEEFFIATNEGDLADVQRGIIDCPRGAEIENEMHELMRQIAAEHP